MDASVIQAKHHRPNKGAVGESTQATEAAYNVKQSSDGKQKTTDGYKAHLNVEEELSCHQQYQTSVAKPVMPIAKVKVLRKVLFIASL